jgi:hypothetical protein
MRRHLLSFFAAFSLLLCAATIVFWHRSFLVVDGLTVTDPLTEGAWPTRKCYLWSDRGRLVFIAQSRPGSPALSSLRYLRHVDHVVHARDDGDGELPVFVDAFLFPRPAVAGFNWSRGSSRSGNFLCLRVPYWALAVAFMVLPSIGVSRGMRRRRRRRQGACEKCGYDLRATPDRCPECGAPAESAVATRRRAEPPAVPDENPGPSTGRTMNRG